MNELKGYDRKLPVPGLENENRVLLDELKDRLKNDPTIYFAGELTNPKDDEGRFDQHDLFIAPSTPLFDPAELTELTKRVLAGFSVTSQRGSRMHQNGDMQLPDAFVDQHIGDREINVTTTTRVKTGSFKGLTAEVVDEENHIQKLMQRTNVKVFTDPFLAQTLFDYCGALARKELDERQSTNLFAVYATHIISAKHLVALKGHYQSSGNELPRLPFSK